eukprot:SAG22_NODE_1489_length_4310_cov_7.945856_4_plen_225_part_00
MSLVHEIARANMFVPPGCRLQVGNAQTEQTAQPGQPARATMSTIAFNWAMGLDGSRVRARRPIPRARPPIRPCLPARPQNRSRSPNAAGANRIMLTRAHAARALLAALPYLRRRLPAPGRQLSWFAYDFATTILSRRGIEGEELAVLHISAPQQKKAQVPPLLRPERLESEVEGKNLTTRLKVSFIEETREPDKKCGETLTDLTNKCVFCAAAGRKSSQLREAC